MTGRKKRKDKQIKDIIKHFEDNMGRCELCGEATYSKNVKLCSYHERVRDRQRTTKELIMD